MTFPPSAEPIADAQRVLCIAAHPDDLDFGCSGTVAAWVAQGLDVTYLIVTRGEAGGPRRRSSASAASSRPA